MKPNLIEKILMQTDLGIGATLADTARLESETKKEDLSKEYKLVYNCLKYKKLKNGR